jgi:hypothetical protein
LRQIIIPPKPTTDNIKALPLGRRQNAENFPNTIRGIFDAIDGQTVTFIPESWGRGKSFSRFLFEAGLESYYVRITDDWTIDLSTTTINTTTKTGGIVDGITKASDRTYLIWAFLDNTFSFAGIGATRKPYSLYTGPASVPKNTQVSITGLTDAYQFVVGSRIAIRNVVGTSPLFEWNWATVDSIDSSTQITITTDNESYGSALTAATGGEVIQWDQFKPYVVTASSQTLYQPYYCLLGEVTTGTTDIEDVYRVDDPWRYVDNNQYHFYNSSSAQPGATIYLGRYIPLWATMINCWLAIRSTTAGRIFTVRTRSGFGQLDGQIQVASIVNRVSGIVGTDYPASVYLTGNYADIQTFQTRISGYYTPGGMRI